MCVRKRLPLWNPAERNVSVALGNGGGILAVARTVASAIGSRCPLWDFAIDRHLCKGNVVLRRHQEALVIDVDVLVNEHGIVVPAICMCRALTNKG